MNWEQFLKLRNQGYFAGEMFGSSNNVNGFRVNNAKSVIKNKLADK